MLTISDNELPVYQVLGTTLRINHSPAIVEKIDMMTEATKTEYHYTTAVCFITSDRSTRIEAIIASVYVPSAEIATINNKDSKPLLYEAYQEFRLLAKTLADGWEYQ
jgi:hypothetical protein